jgi:hypothetical protein
MGLGGMEGVERLLINCLTLIRNGAFLHTFIAFSEELYG